MSPVEFIDAHFHASSRSGEDFPRLAVAGCVGLVSVAGCVGGYRSADSVLDHFRRLHLVDRRRVEAAGIAYTLALGIHPAGIPDRGVDEVLDALCGLLAAYGAGAVGEIGLERGGEEEERVFARQLELAAAAGLPVVVHTPRENKLPIARRILELVEDSPLAPGRVLLDHLDEPCIGPARDAGVWMGLSIHPAKLSPDRAAALVARDGSGRFVLTTDTGINPSHLFGIPAAICAMEDAGVDEEAIRAVVHDHPARLLGAER